ncbi:MAG: metallophosphoesterase [Thermoleophilaceae bacterium]|nr:metallophosphoesterase [Thermoleophilaceae bacterium]
MNHLRSSIAMLSAVAALLVVATSAAAETEIYALGDGADGSAQSIELSQYIQRQQPDRFFYLGDVYDIGTWQEFQNNYHPVYGPLAPITDPVIGNHEAPAALFGYYPYWLTQRGWGPARAARRSYVDQDSGWQVIAYNSEALNQVEEAKWVAGQVIQRRGDCRVVIAHKGRFTAHDGSHGDNLSQALVWQAFRFRAAINLVGHNHIYGRLAPIDGVNIFVTGAGGHGLRSLDPVQPHKVAASATGVATATHLTLRRGSADFEQVDKNGVVYDSGTISCRPA